MSEPVTEPGGSPRHGHTSGSGSDDAAWADYLYMRTNAKGLFAERWVHQHGCRRWFNLLRDTTTHRIVSVYKIGEKPPLGSAPAGSHGGDP